MLVKVPTAATHIHHGCSIGQAGGVQWEGWEEGVGRPLCSGFIAICPGLMKVPCSAPVCLLSSPLRGGKRRGGEGGGRERESERDGRDLTSLFFPFSLCAGAGKHMSPLHSGQEDKRARKRKKERSRRERERKKNRVG